MSAARNIEGVRNADKRVLFPQPRDRCFGRQVWGDFFGNECAKQFSLLGHNFLAHDHKLRRKFLSMSRAARRVVVSHDHAIQSLRSTRINQYLGMSQAIL